ncbi:COMM domain-containing protein 8 [Seriola lalandi dorsalis]|uniref:COMM domain-containing protein 8 n=1 Tax=Seriola lalandi dorsalis TaxID=1841481 RepID=UPI000C6FA9FB|nr:COMM domain-containing protein 8 [Seriola lalandi dorsalis]XP_023250511.1 COMM domain-containing protein 8 [Seriola lalandi dorsalis]
MVVLLSRLPVADSLKLCHRVVDGLCGRQPPCRGDYSATWSLEEWLELLSSLTALFRLAVGNNSSDEEVLAGLSGVGSGGHADTVLSVLRAREEEIRRALLDRTNSISTATLQDFDWQLKLALSSDKISSLHTPLLSLSLDVREDGALRPVTMEMNRDELNTLINSLEAANKVMLQLK